MVNFRPPPPPEQDSRSDFITESIGTQTNLGRQANIGTQTGQLLAPTAQHQVTQTLQTNFSDNQTQTTDSTQTEVNPTKLESQTVSEYLTSSVLEIRPAC